MICFICFKDNVRISDVRPTNFLYMRGKNFGGGMVKLEFTVCKECAQKRVDAYCRKVENRPYKYSSGFEVGEIAEIIEGKQTYNKSVRFVPGALVTIAEPPNIDFPDDAVQIRLGTGEGAIDAHLLKKYTPLIEV